MMMHFAQCFLMLAVMFCLKILLMLFSSLLACMNSIRSTNILHPYFLIWILSFSEKYYIKLYVLAARITVFS
jgi:hypothetical protein